MAIVCTALASRRGLRRWLNALLLAFLVMTSTGSARAADATYMRGGAVSRMSAPDIPYAPPVPSRRAAAVWASESCWRGCTSQCGAEFQACLRVEWIDNCNNRDNACNRTCQKACRLYGGPLLNWTD